MKDFIKRNSPVFIIGFITLLIFVGIIILAQKNSTNGPTLEKIDKTELITDHTPTKGNKDAKVYLVEFSDFECPACKAYEPIVERIVDKYKEKVYFGYRHFPLPQHTNARPASIASMAAYQQGKFWEYSSKLFGNQTKLEEADLIKYAEELNLDIQKFKQDIADEKVIGYVDRDMSQAAKLGLNSTPTFFLNGNIMQLKSVADLETKLLEEMKNQGINTDVSNSLTTKVDIAEESTPSADVPDLSNLAADIAITYTEQGFSPSHIKAAADQVVVWTNKTDRDMNLEQLIKSYSQFNSPITVKAGESYKLVLTHKNLWTYKESSIKHYGSIFVITEE